MTDTLSDYLASDQFMPHGMCFLWRPDILWMHVGSDLLVALAYFTIPVALIYYVTRRGDLGRAFDWLIGLFAAFILFCGLTHIMGIWVLWNPDYVVQGYLKLATAIVSVATAAVLWPLVPRALAVPHPRELEAKTLRLAEEIAVRRRAEAALKQAHNDLERRVEERTAELAAKAQELNQANRFLDSVLEHIPSAIFVKRADDLTIAGANAAALNIIEMERDEVLGKTDAVFLPKAAASLSAEQDREVVASGRNLHLLDHHFATSITHRYFETSKVAIKNSGGDCEFVLEISDEITLRKLAEMALQTRENQLRLMADALPVLITYIDSNRIYRFTNKTFGEWLGVDPAQCIGRHTADAHGTVYDPDGYEKALAGEKYRESRSIAFPTGHRIVEFVYIPNPSDNGNIDGIYVLGTDITEERRVNAELIRMNAELARSNTELDDFAYIASHDLKEPLRGIHNFSQILIEDYADKLGADGRLKLETLVRLSERLEGLISSLLEYSRTGRTELAVRLTDLNQLVDGIIDSLRITLTQSGIDVKVGQLPELVCDSVRTGEVYRNLITNAMRYNDKDEKAIEIGVAGNDEAGNPVLFVRDNGIGIRPKHQDAIFRIFKRLHPRDAYGGGSGAGLTIAKKIIERHGGRIWVESEPGQGSTFFFTLG